ncbi:MAG: hypothetical protein R2722_17620 [Tessaracoccus sp.]
MPGHRLHIQQLTLPISLTLHTHRISRPTDQRTTPRGLFSRLLGLARGLLRDATVLVLDEPTAGLDTRTEADFLAAIAQARRGRTTILVSHRLAVLQLQTASCSSTTAASQPRATTPR